MNPVLTKLEGSIFEITLNRPESLNALNAEMMQALAAAVDEAANNPAVRCVVLKGSGAGFMAGGDIKFFQQSLSAPSNGLHGQFKQFVEGIHPFVQQLANLPLPVVASVHGAVAGFGVSLTMLCDFVIASEDAFFTLAYIHLGTSPDGSSTFFLPRLVGLRRAKEIALLGDRISAHDAHAVGLAYKVVPRPSLDSETATFAARLAASPTQAYGRTKKLLLSSFDRKLEDQLEAEATSFADCAVTPDFSEGVRAFLERRKPAFTGKKS
ncbi:MAG TPA: enoyl-CoA hydratase [Candidatus Angelobacter sp.]|nr:enoyl-CoA hydratase [Candidatus Angelobacter sp.]